MPVIAFDYEAAVYVREANHMTGEVLYLAAVRTQADGN